MHNPKLIFLSLSSCFKVLTKYKIFWSLFYGACLTSVRVMYAKSYFQPLSSVPLINISLLSQHHCLKDYCFVACSNVWWDESLLISLQTILFCFLACFSLLIEIVLNFENHWERTVIFTNRLSSHSRTDPLWPILQITLES